MSTESPHQRVARQTDADVRRNERMIDAVQGLSRQLAATERTLETFIASLSGAARGAEEQPPGAATPPPVRSPRPAATPIDGRPPAGLADHVMPGAHRSTEDPSSAGADA